MIHLSIQVEDAEIERLLVLIREHFPKADFGDQVYMMEQAVNLLRIADKYALSSDSTDAVELHFSSEVVSLVPA